MLEWRAAAQQGINTRQKVRNLLQIRSSPFNHPLRLLSAACRYGQLDEAAFRAFEAGFSSHPAWLALQQRGRAEAAHLTRMLDELQAAAAAAAQEEQAASQRPQ